MAKINIINIDLPKNKYSIKAPYEMKPIGITIHETDNNASARNEIAYMQRNNNKVSFHFAVDEKEIIQGLPLDRNGWHASDGNGTGNRKTIAIEICRNYDRNTGGIPKEYYKARENAEKLVGYLLHKYGWTDKDIYTHHHWIGKNCPRRIREQGYLNTFKKNAMNWKNKFSGNSETPVETTKKDLDTIASEVIRGDWGNGADRKRNLEKAGYNYAEVQKAVNARLSSKKPTQSKPKPKPTPQPEAQGNKVTVKESATHFDTGEKMDNWVKGYTFDVLQKGKGRTLIAKGNTAIGWVKNSDLVGNTAQPAPKPKPKPQAKPKYKPVTAQVVNDVILGKYGNGAARKKNLEKAGYNYKEVQDAVNRSYGAKPKEPTIKRGDKIKIKASGKDLNKNIKFASWVYNTTMYVTEVQKRGYVFSDKKHGGVIGVVGRNHVVKV